LFSLAQDDTNGEGWCCSAEPAWLDLQGGVEKTIALIQQAGKDGVNVLGFPEVWLTGYPW